MERLNSSRYLFEKYRINNHIWLPLAVALLVAQVVTYSGTVIILILAFSLPSLFFNVIFLLLPLYAKTYILMRTSFGLFQVIIVTILLIYIVNLIVVFGTLT